MSRSFRRCRKKPQRSRISWSCKPPVMGGFFHSAPQGLKAQISPTRLTRRSSMESDAVCIGDRNEGRGRSTLRAAGRFFSLLSKLLITKGHWGTRRKSTGFLCDTSCPWWLTSKAAAPNWFKPRAFRQQLRDASTASRLVSREAPRAGAELGDQECAA